MFRRIESRYGFPTIQLSGIRTQQEEDTGHLINSPTASPSPRVNGRCFP